LPKDDFYTPTDIDALRMENELLAFEVRFLKAQLAETERLKSQLEEAERSKAEVRRQLDSQLEESRNAKKDLALLLRRLGNSPLGPFFRTRSSFRTLERRYLDADV
jgi:hypothetical protein